MLFKDFSMLILQVSVVIWVTPPLHAVAPPVVQNDPTPAARVQKLARYARQFFNTGGGRRVILDHRWRHGVEWRRYPNYNTNLKYEHGEILEQHLFHRTGNPKCLVQDFFHFMAHSYFSCASLH